MRYYKVYRFYDPGDGENGPRLEETLAGRFDTLEEAQAFAGESSRIEETDTDDKDPMELIAYLYSFMDDEEKTDWSRQAAENMVTDQRRYEIAHGITPREYDAKDFYDTIAELIAQDTEDGEL